jgi:hypothetical protein
MEHDFSRVGCSLALLASSFVSAPLAQSTKINGPLLAHDPGCLRR